MEIMARSTRRTLWQSITIEVLNPKTAIFCIAFLSRFTDGAVMLPIWAQLLILGTIINVMFSSADVLCVLLAGKVTRMMKASRCANQLAQRVVGGILVGLGLNLAFNRN